jgi:hypothetical protein
MPLKPTFHYKNICLIRSLPLELTKEDVMLFKILGCFWIVSGSYSFLRPVSFMRRLQRGSGRTLRRLFFLAAFTWGAPLIALGWKNEGFVPKVILVFGIIAVVKSVFFLTSRASDAFIRWTLNASPLFFRLFALVQVLAGIALNAYSSSP